MMNDHLTSYGYLCVEPSALSNASGRWVIILDVTRGVALPKHWVCPIASNGGLCINTSIG